MENTHSFRSYIDTIQSRHKRRQELYNSWLFWCECPLCADPTENGTYLSNPICTDCSDDCNTHYFLPEEPLNPQGTDWVCEKCQHRLWPQDVADMEDKDERLSKTHYKNVRRDYKFVVSYSQQQQGGIQQHKIEEVSDSAERLAVEKCELLLPIFEKLGDPVAKSKLFSALAKSKLKMYSLDLKASKIDKAKYLRAVKPYLAVQIQATALHKKFSTP